MVANPAVDHLGNVFTTFSGSRGQKVPVSIYKVDLNYNVHPFVRDLMNPTGLAFDRMGQLYVSCRNDGTIVRVSGGPQPGYEYPTRMAGGCYGVSLSPEHSFALPLTTWTWSVRAASARKSWTKPTWKERNRRVHDDGLLI